MIYPILSYLLVRRGYVKTNNDYLLPDDKKQNGTSGYVEVKVNGVVQKERELEIKQKE